MSKAQKVIREVLTILFIFVMVTIVAVIFQAGRQTKTPDLAIISPSPTATTNTKPKAVTKPLPTQIVVAPPSPNQSGPPVVLYTKASTNVYACPKITCEVIYSFSGGTQFSIPYTPTESWLFVRTNDGQDGYMELSQMIKGADAPAHCSVPLAYNIGIINDKFLAEGWNRESLLGIVQVAEHDWEQALGKDLFNYAPGEINNVIQFIVDDYAVENLGHIGLNINRLFPNGTVAYFRTTIPTRFFDILDPYRQSYPVAQQQQLEEEFMKEVMIHELGHALGFNGHLDSKTAIMSKESQRPTIPYHKLTEDDITALQAWCSAI